MKSAPSRGKAPAWRSRESRHAAARLDVPTADRIPYSAHVTGSIVRTWDGAYLQVLRLAGASFESADDVALNAWHQRLNVLWRNIAAPEVALWTHVIRRRETAYPPGKFPPGFAADLNARYRDRMAGETLMVNELYLSLLYRPAPGAAQGLTLKALTGARAHEANLERASSIEACEKLAGTVLAALEPYDPEPLGVYIHRGRVASSLLEFLGTLVNGEAQRMPLPRGPLNEFLSTSRLFFGVELLEQRTPTQARWGAMLGIKEYPTPTTPGLFNGLLAAPFPFVLTQSFAFVSKATAQGLLQRQSARMGNVGDFAVSQARELTDALDALTSNEFVMGEHHLSLQVQTELTATGGGRAENALAKLNDDVALARSMLSDCGMTVAREDLALEPAFWAQLPGAFTWRPRRSVITSRNFAAMAPFHNYPSGRPDGNHWGEALTLLATSARSPFYFSLHASDPREEDGGSRRDTGHTLICGPTGSGKTVFIGFLVAMLEKQGVTQILIDKDRGLEILVRAMGGTYFALEHGLPTGFNPLQLPPTPANTEFLRGWLRVLARPRIAGSAEVPLTVRQEADLVQALAGTLALDRSARRLSRLIEFLDPTDPEGVHARLAPWCASMGGELAWVFDNEEDAIAGRLATATLAGFDVTQFLDSAQLRTPITLYLFHLIRELLDGRRFVCWMDEFWRLIEDPAFERFAKDGPKTWRKLNAVMCLATQSPSDVLGSPLARTLIEQTPTKVFFPNVDASRDYVEGFGLSEREYALIKETLTPGSRQFLVKQGAHSVVAQLDLKGFNSELAVISGRAETVEFVRHLIEYFGDDPNAWLTVFQARALTHNFRPIPEQLSLD
jgi:type IV secretion system protein VirB4